MHVLSPWTAAALGLLVVLSLLLGLAAWAWRRLTGPMYAPGRLAQRTDLQPAALDSEGPWQVEPGVSLAHQCDGTGPTVLVVHGGPGVPPVRLAPGLAALTDAYRVHTFHQRGCGASTRPYDGATSKSMRTNVQALESVLGVGAQLADLERIRRILGEERIILVGHSYGALLAALYAAELPERVEALVLVAPADLLQFPSPHGGLFDQLRAALPVDQQPAYDAWLAEYLDLPGVFARSTAELEALDAQLVRFYEAATGPLPPDQRPAPDQVGVWHARAQYFSGGMRHDWRPALASVQVRTLVIHGETDLQPVDVAEQYTSAIGGAQLHTIAGAGHSPQSTHAETFHRVVRAFLRAG